MIIDRETRKIARMYPNGNVAQHMNEKLNNLKNKRHLKFKLLSILELSGIIATFVIGFKILKFILL